MIGKLYDFITFVALVLETLFIIKLDRDMYKERHEKD